MRLILYPALFLLCISTQVLGQSKLVDSLTREVDSRNNDTNKVKACCSLAGLVRSTDPSRATAYGRQGIALGKELNFARGLASCYVNISAAYISASRLDSALLFIDTAIVFAHEMADPNRLALVYLNRADMYMQLQNLNASLRDCDTALKYAELANNDDRRARIYQTIGSVYYVQKKHRDAIPYYEKAFQLYEQVNAKQMSAIVLNNLGNIHKHLGEPDRAIAHFEKAIAIADSLGNTSNMSMYYGNLSNAYVTKKDYDKAEALLNKAMRYAEQQNNEHQQAITLVQFGELYVEQKKYADAVQAGSRSFSIMKNAEDIAWQQTAADLLAEAYWHTGDYKKAFEYQKISKELNDTLARQKFDEDIAAMQTNFKVEEKNKEIQLLSKDSQIKEAQLRQQRILLFGSIALLALMLTGIVLLINRNRLRQRMKELELRNRIAADLHDEVGSSLSSIHLLSQMARDQHAQQSNATEILEKVSTNAYETMEKMSDIVWMVKPAGNEGQSLKTRMERFTHELCNARQIECGFSAAALDNIKLSMPQKKNLYLIFKEALNNAVKYSGTKKLDIHVGVQQHHVLLKIKDYGKGFDESIIRKGNGLDNMHHRARELKGTLKVASQPGVGTEINLSFPV